MKPINEMTEEELDEALEQNRAARRAGIEEKKKRTKAKNQRSQFDDLSVEDQALLARFLKNQKG